MDLNSNRIFNYVIILLFAASCISIGMSVSLVEAFKNYNEYSRLLEKRISKLEETEFTENEADAMRTELMLEFESIRSDVLFGALLSSGENLEEIYSRLNALEERLGR